MTQKAKIIVVDDTAPNLTLLVDLLSMQGYSMVTATSGLEALELIEKEHPDLVLVDVVMPGIDGFEVCRQLRANPRTALLPVILVTAMYPSEERARGIEVGADDFLTKPVNKAELLARVRSLLRIKVLHDAVEAHAGEVEEWNKKLEARLEQEAKLAEVARSLGDMAHEIKNLLMPIVTGSGLLRSELEELFGRLPEREITRAKASQRLCEEIIEMLTNAADRIHDEVRTVADCVKGLSSPVQFAPCHVTEVVQSVFKTLHLTAHQRQISLHAEDLESLPSIQADQRRLFNAFFNLMHNAIPEVRAGGSITVRGKAVAEENTLVLSVIDNGRGMPAELRDSLFTSSVVSRKAGGTGLGTKIIKDVVDAHGGQITVESWEGVGTTFHIRLPIDPAPREIMPAQPLRV